MKKYLLLILVVVFAFVSCKDEEAKTYNLTGIVTNVTNNPVINVDVVLAKQGETTAVYTATTDTEGKYAFTAAKEGDYSLIVTVNGYTTSTTDISLSSTQTKDVQIVGTATVGGFVLNSQTGAGVPNATITCTPSDGKGVTYTGAEVTTLTDIDGNWTITSCPTGVFEIRISGTGFTDRVFIFTINDGENQVEDQTLVEGVSEGQLRIILSWGLEPGDLDSHLTGPSSTTPGERFHCYYSNQEPDANISLDLDDTDSYGPETTTIGALLDGTYNFSVYNYSDQSETGAAGIYNSPAKVEIYDINGLLFTYNAPAATSGNTWFAIKIVVASGVYTISNPNEYLYFAGSEVVEGMGKPVISGKHIF